MGQIKPTATLCGKPHESEDAHQSRIRYGEGKAQKRHTLKHRNTRPCLACFRSEIIIIIIIIMIIIMIIVGYVYVYVFGKLNTSTVCEKHKQVAKDNAIFILIGLEKITSSPE